MINFAGTLTNSYTMNADILYFLGEHCPEFLQNALEPCGYALSGKENLSINGNTISFDKVGEKVLSNIYSRLLSVKKKSGHNPAPEEYKDKYNQLIREIEDEFAKKTEERQDNLRVMVMAMAIQSSPSISDIQAIQIIENFSGLNQGLLESVSQKTKPEQNLSYENYKRLKGLLKEDMPLYGLEYYSGESEEAYALWKDAIIDRFKTKAEIKEFSARAVTFLLKVSLITITDAINYFTDKENFTWNDIKELIAMLLDDKTQFNSITSLLNHFSEDNYGLVQLLEDFEIEQVSHYVTSLRDSDINIAKLPSKAVNVLFGLGVISVDSVVNYYLSREEPSWGTSWGNYSRYTVSWEEIEGIISEVLKNPSQFDNLFLLLEHCNCGLEHLYDKFDLNTLENFSSYLKEKEYSPKTQSSGLVNRLYEAGTIDMDSVIAYYQTHPQVVNDWNRDQYWNGINEILTNLLSDATRFEGILSLVKRDQFGLSYLFKSFDFNALLPFIEFLQSKGLSKIELFLRLPDDSRETLFISSIENGTPLDHETELREYFDHFGNSVSMNMYATLFSMNYYYRFILSSFRNKLRTSNRNSMIEMKDRATDTRAWGIAVEILSSFLK